jgi:hypothetical protein
MSAILFVEQSNGEGCPYCLGLCQIVRLLLLPPYAMTLLLSYLSLIAIYLEYEKY